MSGGERKNGNNLGNPRLCPPYYGGGNSNRICATSHPAGECCSNSERRYDAVTESTSATRVLPKRRDDPVTTEASTQRVYPKL